MNCMNETIQPADRSQSMAIAALVNQAYRPAADAAGWTHESALVAGDRTSLQQVEKLFRPGSQVLIATRGNEMAACVHVEHVAQDCWIGMLATLPAAQNAGLGKRMLMAAEAFALAHFAPKRLMMSVLSSRAELLGFYQRRGYQLTGRFSEYPREAGVGTPLVADLRVLELSKLAPSVD